MAKAIVSAAVICMLFVFSMALYTIQTTATPTVGDAGGISEGSPAGGNNVGSAENSVESYSDTYSDYEVYSGNEVKVIENSCYNSKNIIINEIYPCPKTCMENGIGGIELYNMGNSSVNVSKWYLKNITGYVMAAIKNEEIPPNRFLVVGVDGLTRNYQELILVDSCGNKVCSVMYTGAEFNKGLSYARIPDGGNIWKWMNSTLGYSNLLGKESVS